MSQTAFDFQKTLLNIATNELTSHSVMLFATLTPTFAFLKVINDYNINNNSNIPLLSKIIFFSAITILIGLSIYVLCRLLFWAIVLNATLYFDTQNTIFTDFKAFINNVFDDSFKKIQRSKLHSFLLDENDTIRLIILSISMGCILSVILLYSIEIF